MALNRHQRAFLQLLPQGLAWNTAPDTLLAHIAEALSRSAARVTERAQALLSERFPSTASLLLEDWERFLGLPDCDIGEGAGVAERQVYAANKMRLKPSLNRQFYISLAQAYGFTVTIHNPPESQWVSIITIKDHVKYRNMHVLDPITTPLRVYSAGILECLLNRYKPAHQEFRYVYEQPEEK